VPVAVASVTVVADDLARADIDATSAYASDQDALDRLRSRPGRRGLVVWRDGRSDVVGTAA
jgi:thiamine biosynthesis lipoprotein